MHDNFQLFEVRDAICSIKCFLFCKKKQFSYVLKNEAFEGVVQDQNHLHLIFHFDDIDPGTFFFDFLFERVPDRLVRLGVGFLDVCVFTGFAMVAQQGVRGMNCILV